MHFLEAIIEALRTLRSERLRSFLTLFGIVWGTASVVFLLSWGLGVQAMLEEGFTRVGKNLVQAWPGMIGEQYTPAVDRRQLWFTLDDVEAVRERSRLADTVAGESRMQRMVTYRQRAFSFDIRGVEPQQMRLRGVRIGAGRSLSQADLEHRRRVAVLGDVARRRLLGPEGGVDSWIRIDGRPFRVVGLLERVGTQLWRDQATELDEQIWIPLKTLFAFGPRRGRDLDVVDSILLRVRHRQLYDALKQETRSTLAQRLRVSATDEEAISIASPMDQLRQLPIDQSVGLLLILGATTLVIGGVGVLNMMLDSVQERKQEIGVRMAVGARRRDIVGQFFLETFVITAFGGGIGLALGIGGCRLLAELQVPDLIPVPILKAEVVWMALGIMSFVGFSSGLIPAWRAARVDPSVTLRAE
jgi:putative ABC transport system permease protein